jgi:hypothetical protein
MPDAQITDLLKRSQFVFEATVEDVGRSTVADLPVTDHTIVVMLDRVLHSPAALAQTTGSRVTVQLLEGSPKLATGDRVVFFTTALAFGEHIAVQEVGRTQPDEAGPTMMAAGSPATLPGARPGRAHPVLDAAQELDDERLRGHAEEAEDVVVGRVVKLERVGPVAVSEHDPDWWRATIHVEHAEKGRAHGQIQVLYPNSSDVRWARIPKLHSGQEGLWILHATQGEDSSLAPYRLLDTDDAQPADHLDRIQPEDG